MSKAHTWYNSLTSEDSTVTTIDIGPVVMLRQRFSSWIKWISYAKDLRNFLATKSKSHRDKTQKEQSPNPHNKTLTQETFRSENTRLCVNPCHNSDVE
jgi:hypothetical protein